MTFKENDPKYQKAFIETINRIDELLDEALSESMRIWWFATASGFTDVPWLMSDIPVDIFEASRRIKEIKKIIGEDDDGDNEDF